MTTLHHLHPGRASLHGQYNAALTPALTVRSGDVVHAHDLLDVSWGQEQHGEAGQPRLKWGPREGERDAGPALHGPIAVEGAEPGMVLEVELLEVRPGPWGWTWVGPQPSTRAWHAGLGIAPETQALVRWTLDADRGGATSEHGHAVDLAPFPGMIGVCPAGPGWHEAWSPRQVGGNMDCPELVVGARLFFPVAVPGALLSLGDGHARQGYGEVAGTAIECPMERVAMRLTLHEGQQASGLTALTPRGRVTFGFDAELHRAAELAMAGMLDHLVEALGVDRSLALALASPVVDLHVTQVVNGVCGVHAVLPHGALRLPGR